MVKHHGSPSIKVPIDGYSNIDDFAEKVGQELNTNCQVALFTSLDKEALRTKELLKTDLRNNNEEYPLFVKLIHSICQKTIFFRYTDSRPFEKRVIENDADLQKLYLSSPNLKNYLPKFNQLKEMASIQGLNNLFRVLKRILILILCIHWLNGP